MNTRKTTIKIGETVLSEIFSRLADQTATNAGVINLSLRRLGRTRLLCFISSSLHVITLETSKLAYIGTLSCMQINFT